MEKYTFTARTLTVGEKVFPARYELQDEADMKRGQVFPTVHIWATVDEKSVLIDVPADDPAYGAALQACKQAQQEEEAPAQEEEAPAQEEEAQQETPPDHSEPQEAPAQVEKEEPAQEEAPARDPKQARGPIPEKTFAGTSIKGARYTIVFDDIAQRTRVIIPKEYRAAIQAAVEKAGFYYSPILDSWNKKLTFKAYRAAQALAQELDKLAA